MVLKKLFSHIQESAHLYHEAWQHLYAQQTDKRNTQEILAICETQLQRQGVTTRMFGKTFPLVFGELSTGSPRTLLLYCHVQSPSLWHLLPIAASLCAVDAYQASSGSLPINVKWLLSSGESSASRLTNFVRDHTIQLQADGAIWCINELTERYTPVLTLGTKGLLRVKLELRTASIEVPSMYGSIVPNAAWRLLWALNSLKSAGEEMLIEGFYDPLISTMDESLYALPDIAEELAGQWGSPQMLLGLRGFQLHYARLLTPTCTITKISGGKASTLPIYAHAEVEFQLLPAQDPHHVFQQLQRHLQQQGFEDIRVRLLHAHPPVSISPDEPFVQAVVRAAALAYGHDPYLFPFTTGAYLADSFWKYLNIPIVFTQLNAPETASQEYGSPQDLSKAAKLIAHTMHEMANGYTTA